MHFLGCRLFTFRRNISFSRNGVLLLPYLLLGGATPETWVSVSAKEPRTLTARASMLLQVDAAEAGYLLLKGPA
jgi:hypothetical protein